MKEIKNKGLNWTVFSGHVSSGENHFTGNKQGEWELAKQKSQRRHFWKEHSICEGTAAEKTLVSLGNREKANVLGAQWTRKNYKGNKYELYRHYSLQLLKQASLSLSVSLLLSFAWAISSVLN